jgi:hypothetical protein
VLAAWLERDDVLAAAKVDRPHDVHAPVEWHFLANGGDPVEHEASGREEDAVLVGAVDTGDRTVHSPGHYPDSACFQTAIDGKEGVMLASLSAVFHSTAFTVTADLVLFCAVLIWLGVAFWTHRDAKRRLDDPLLIWAATALGLVPLAGPLVYLLFRPPETLADVRARRAELRALEAHLERRGPVCPVCRAGVEPAFLVCPVCTTRLKEPCRACGAALEPLWQACPHCGVHIDAPVPVDLDAALTAEAAANGSEKARSRRPRRAAAS